MRKLASLSLLTLALSAASHAVYGLRDGTGPLQVTYETTDLGGLYRYDLTLLNRSAVGPVWWWGAYLPLPDATLLAVSGFDLPQGYAGEVPTDMRYAGYPTVAYAYSGLSSGGSDGISVGETGTLSFTSSALVSGELEFFADVLGEWSPDGSLPFDQDGTQVYSYLGETGVVPEPASMAALGLGAIALLRRRRLR